MILLSLLAIAAPVAVQDVPEIPDTEEQIVVVGRRLDGIAVSVGRDPRGSFHCSLDRSTGYAKLDDRLCRATVACVRKGKGKSDDAGIKACIAKTKPRLLVQLRKEMKGKRR